MSAKLATNGVKPEMEFVCCDCHEVTTGAQVLSGECDIHIARHNREKPIDSTFRCECCEAEHRELLAEMAEANDDY